jgi:hypothetical protein
MYRSIGARPALGKNHDGRPVLDLSCCGTNGLHRGAWIFTVDRDMTGALKMPSQKWNSKKLLLSPGSGTAPGNETKRLEYPCDSGD